MTAPASAAPSTTIRSRHSALGIAAVAITAVPLLGVLVIVLISLIPEMNAILWLMLVIIPVVVALAAVGLILGIVALVLAIRGRRSLVFPIIGIALPVAVIFVGCGLMNGWFYN